MRFSVVVTIVDGKKALESCLRALQNQDPHPEMEILVPFDDTVTGLPLVAEQFQGVRLIDMGHVRGTSPPDTRSGRRELYDLRRSAGLRHARGDLVALIEDRCVPRRDWAATVLRLHSRGCGVIGGAVENGVDRLLNWAVYFCDFTRYQLPFDPGPAVYVSDVNVSYKRPVIESVRDQWEDRFLETCVHWALQERGERLFLDPGMVVYQMRNSLGLGALLFERFQEGRLFAYTRARVCGPLRRFAYLAGSPLLPAILYLRHAGTQLRKQIHLGRFIQASPLVILFLLLWSLGEAWAYLTRRP